jgi:hypothetical protein
MAGNPIVISGTHADIVGSKLHAEIGYGDTSDLTSPSQKIGEKIKRSPIAQSIVGSDPVIANPGSWQTRPVSPAQAVATNPGMKGAMASAPPGKSQSPRPSSVPGNARTNQMPAKGKTI